MSLSGRTKSILQTALADRVAGNELATAVDLDNWANFAMQLAPGSAPSAAFTAGLVAGDLVTAVNHTTGATTFAVVTTNGTFPSLTITTGDLLTDYRPVPVGAKGLIFPDADEGTDPGYRDADPPNYVPADPTHKNWPAT